MLTLPDENKPITPDPMELWEAGNGVLQRIAAASLRVSELSDAIDLTETERAMAMAAWDVLFRLDRVVNARLAREIIAANQEGAQ